MDLLHPPCFRNLETEMYIQISKMSDHLHYQILCRKICTLCLSISTHSNMEKYQLCVTFCSFSMALPVCTKSSYKCRYFSCWGGFELPDVHYSFVIFLVIQINKFRYWEWPFDSLVTGLSPATLHFSPTLIGILKLYQRK